MTLQMQGFVSFCGVYLSLFLVLSGPNRINISVLWHFGLIVLASFRTGNGIR